MVTVQVGSYRLRVNGQFSPCQQIVKIVTPKQAENIANKIATFTANCFDEYEKHHKPDITALNKPPLRVRVSGRADTRACPRVRRHRTARRLSPLSLAWGGYYYVNAPTTHNTNEKGNNLWTMQK
jgi:hypothetical protein